MTYTRALAALTVATGLLAPWAAQAQPAPQAQTGYPTKPVTLVVPFPAGGPTDAMARALGLALGERLGQPVIIDNRGGAGGAIAAELVARAPADGYTLFFGTTGTMAINPSLYTNLRYDPVHDFAPISLMATTMNVLVIGPQLPVKDLGELVAHAKVHPGQLTYGSAGNGSSNHLSGELFRTTADIDIAHIPYRGSAPAVVDLLGGRLSMMFDTVAQQVQNIATGKVSALAVTGPERSPLLPDVPTAQEMGLKDFDVTIWFGVLAPGGTPEPVIEQLQGSIEEVMQSEAMRQRMQAEGAQARTTSPAEFAELIQRDIARWEPVVKYSGASLD